MPRNGAGTYTLPAGNPVVDGTIIETTWANPTMADIAVQLNNVLTRDGVLGPNLPFKFIPGSAAAPSATFNTATTTGFYLPTTTSIGVTIGGVASGFFDANGWNGAIVGGVGNFSAVSAAPLKSQRKTTGGIGEDFQTDGAYSQYAQWSYNSGGNVQGSLGGADQLFSGGAITDLALRAESALQFGIGTARTLTLSGAGAGSNVALMLTQADNSNANSNARTVLSVGGASAGDPYIIFNVSGVTDWSLGLDNSDSDKFKLSKSTALGTTDIIVVDSSGNVTVGSATALNSAANRGNIGVNGATTAIVSVGIAGTSQGYLFADSAQIQVGSQANIPVSIVQNGSTALGISVNKVLTDSAGIELGYKGIPRISGNPATATVAVRGQFYDLSGTITLPNAVFASGDSFGMFNGTAGALTITQGAGLSLKLAGTGSTGNRSLAVNGFATVLYITASLAIISGPGVS